MICPSIIGVVLAKKGKRLTIRTPYHKTFDVTVRKTKLKVGDLVYIAIDHGTHKVLNIISRSEHTEMNNEPPEKEETPRFIEEIPELESPAFGSVSETEGWEMEE